MRKTIMMGGREYPCRVTMGAMVRFKRESGRDVSEMREGDVGDSVLFVWCCVKSACSADGVEMEMDFESFADALEPSDLAAFYGGLGEDVAKKRCRRRRSRPWRHRGDDGTGVGVHRHEYG